MKPSKLLLTAGSTLLAITSASAQTPLVATGTSPALSVTTSNSTNYSITGTTEQNSFAGVIRNTSGNNTLSGNIVLNSPTNGIRFDTSSGNLILSGNISQTGTTRAFGLAPASGTTITVSNAIANNGGAFQTLASAFNGTAGTVILNGVSGSGIGSTNIAQNSTLTLGVTNALNTTANLNVAAFGGTDQGTFNLNGFNQTVNGLNSSATGTNRIVRNNSATTASTLTVGNGGGNGSFNGTIVNGGAATLALVKTGTGNQTLSGTNSYTGGTEISGGTLTLGHATNTLANSGSINVNGGTLALGSNSDTVGAVTLTSGSITGSGGVLTGTGSAYDVRSGSVSAILGGSVGLSKTTIGTVTLTGANSYTGATSVTNGILHIDSNGSINSSSGITVNGGHFKYNSSTNLTAPLTFTSGTVSGTNLAGVSLSIGTGDTISPGNSPGTMNVANQTWAAGGTYLWELYDATGVAGTGWDLLAGTGTLDITASLGSEFIIDLTTLAAVAPDVLGDAINFNANTSYAWLIADFASVTGFNTTDFTIDATGFTNAPLSGSFGISLGGVGAVPGDSSQVYLTYTYIPEPGAALLGGLGVLTLLRRRRSS